MMFLAARGRSVWRRTLTVYQVVAGLEFISLPPCSPPYSVAILYLPNRV
jgi:hypothetical protein